ncbi:MAG: hypothetical protein H8D23_15020 [Candidatus Brocadiales bacterium]|nr:hypothetical protein [Candidatus Brocadiales bacterium]
MPKTQNKKREIEFSIKSIKVLEFHESNPSTLPLSESEELNSKSTVRYELGFKPPEDLILFRIYTHFFHESEGEKYPLFSLTSEYAFEVKHFKELFKKTNSDEFDVPHELLVIFINIAIAGTRGMIVASIRNDRYKNIYLPIFNPQKLLQNLLEQQLKNVKEEKQKGV